MCRLIRRENFCVSDDDAFDARRHFERIVLHVFAGAAEDRVQQLLFRGELGLALRRDLADEDVARPTRVPTRTMPLSSRLRSIFSLTFGMSRVNSSRPSLVSRISTSNSSMWIDV
jgi:hypothetical protein